MSTKFRRSRGGRYFAPAGGGTHAASAYWTAVLAQSPWGAWKELETTGTTLADASGNARDLTITGTGTATLAQTGPDGSTADAVSWPNSALDGRSPTIPTASSPATFVCWVYVASTITSITPVMAATNGTTSTNGVVFFDATGTLNARAYNGTSEVLTDPGGAMATGVWNYVAWSVGSAGQTLRVNKVTLATGTNTFMSSMSFASIRVHGHGNYANANGNGPIIVARPAAWLSQLTDAQTDAFYDA